MSYRYATLLILIEFAFVALCGYLASLISESLAIAVMAGLFTVLNFPKWFGGDEIRVSKLTLTRQYIQVTAGGLLIFGGAGYLLDREGMITWLDTQNAKWSIAIGAVVFVLMLIAISQSKVNRGD